MFDSVSTSESRFNGVEGDIKVPFPLAGVGAPVSSVFVQPSFPLLGGTEDITTHTDIMTEEVLKYPFFHVRRDILRFIYMMSLTILRILGGNDCQ